MSPVEQSLELRRELLRELAQRVRWSAMSYALFCSLFSLNLHGGVRVVALCLSGMLAVLGVLRTMFAIRVIGGRDVDRDGGLLVRVSGALAIIFGAFMAFAIWHVRGQVILECLLVVGVTGTASISASIFAPTPGLNRLSVYAQVLPVYAWSIYAQPRYGWVLVAFILIHGVVIAQTIRMNGMRIRDMFIAQLTLERQGKDLRQARDAADRAAKAKMRFLANMSHEIRTPLNGILGLSEVMSQLSLSAEQRAVMDDIASSGRHLLSIVNDILDMAKVTSGKVSLEQEPFDLGELIHDIASPAAALADARQLRFVLETAPGLPLKVRGDALRIRQVVSNLLSNAVKFTPAGEVRLTVGAPRPGWIQFAVADTGIGLSEEQKASLFQEFHQVDSSSTRRFGGSGLGLAISHRFAELMGGNLCVKSSPDRGSTFFFELPLEAIASEATGTPVKTHTPPALLRGLRVLAAEDNLVNQKVMVRLLTRAGVEVEIAGNGLLAVERHQASPYDLILMDCQMPELDGYAATARIRSLPGDAGLVPIIGVTANAFAEDRERCLQAGMNGYVAKPVSLASLTAAMSELV